MAKVVHAMVRVIELEYSVPFYDWPVGPNAGHRSDVGGLAATYCPHGENGNEVETVLKPDRQV